MQKPIGGRSLIDFSSVKNSVTGAYFYNKGGGMSLSTNLFSKEIRGILLGSFVL